jgi:hypothetical protein
MALGDVYKEEMRFVQARTAALLRKHVLGGAIAGGERQGPELCSARGRISLSHGENRGSSPLGSAMKSKAYKSSPRWVQAKTKDRPKIAGVCAVVCGRLVKFAQLA